LSIVAFADSSALVKLYADEPGAEVVRALSVLTVSQLARVVVPAALWRKHRIGELSDTDTALLVAAFEADFYGADGEPARFPVTDITAAVLDDAAVLVGTHGLRAYDSVQLASARRVHKALDESLVFVAFDKSLRRAAVREGLDLAPGDAALSPPELT
jgi:uncharacterized protein